MKKLASVSKKVIQSEVPTTALLMEALPDPVICFGRALEVIYSNHAAQMFFQLGEKKIAGKSMAELLGQESVAFEAAKIVARKNTTLALHHISIQKKPVSTITLTTVEPDAWYLMSIHSAETLPIAHEWNEKTKYSLKSTQMLSQMLAHEIKNPLAGIRGAAQLLSRSGLKPEDQELTQLIAHETMRIQGLVDKFNVFCEVPDTCYKEVNLHEVLDHVIRVARAEYGVDIAIEKTFDPSLPDIHGHFDHLVQAKLNLIKNAAEAFPAKKGRILIRTFYDNAADYHPDRHEKLPLCVEIDDNGPGIASDVLGSIFQPYFTTKASGQGLGLPIVSKIVDDHGGTISVNSRPGKTVFRISLPLPADQARRK